MNAQIHRTTAAAGVSGALAVIFLWVAALRGVPMTADVAIAFVTVITAALGYFFRWIAERESKTEPAAPAAAPTERETP